MPVQTEVRRGLLAGAVCAFGLFPVNAFAQSGDTIKIGVIGEESAVAGASITKAAGMAADEINAKGGVNGRKIEIITYDNHSSAADAVRAFQRAVSQDKVVAVIGSYIPSNRGRRACTCRSSRRAPPATSSPRRCTMTTTIINTPFTAG